VPRLPFKIIAHIGGTARVLPGLPIAQGVAVGRRSPQRFSGRAVVTGAVEVASGRWPGCLPILIRPPSGRITAGLTRRKRQSGCCLGPGLAAGVVVSRSAVSVPDGSISRYLATVCSAGSALGDADRRQRLLAGSDTVMTTLPAA